jgi:hypothetical protein
LWQNFKRQFPWLLVILFPLFFGEFFFLLFLFGVCVCPKGLSYLQAHKVWGLGSNVESPLLAIQALWPRILLLKVNHAQIISGF